MTGFSGAHLPLLETHKSIYDPKQMFDGYKVSSNAELSIANLMVICVYVAQPEAVVVLQARRP